MESGEEIAITPPEARTRTPRRLSFDEVVEVTPAEDGDGDSVRDSRRGSGHSGNEQVPFRPTGVRLLRSNDTLSMKYRASKDSKTSKAGNKDSKVSIASSRAPSRSSHGP